jgi:subtilisin family serine protease
MTPNITLISTALAAGARAAATNLATQAIQDAYDTLQWWVFQRSGGATAVKATLAQLTVNPDVTEHKSTLSAQLAAASEQAPDQGADAVLTRLATTLLHLIAVEEEITGIQVIPADATLAKPEASRSSRNREVATTVDLKVGILNRQAVAMDPKLQRRAAQTIVTKGVVAKGASLSSDRVDLIGQLKNPATPVPGLQIVRQLGDLFTATAAIHDVEAITQHENIITVQLARRVAPTLDFSVAEINGTPAQLRAALPPSRALPDGRGVIVGIVDYGCDFAHNNFRHADGNTRLLALWDQAGPFVEGVSPQGFAQGREFTADAINQALDTDDPYQTLGYNPGIGCHGTHVMDIAVGNGRATSNPGVAPAADIIFVHIDDGHAGQAGAAANARNLMEAVDYIFQKADVLGRPAVINISLGNHSGPHDGSTPVEKWFDQLLQTPNRAIVISAGNSWRHRAHTQGTVNPAQPTLLPWIIRAGDATANEVEIWYSGPPTLAVTLIAPDGKRLLTVPSGHTQAILGDAGNSIASIIHTVGVTGNGDHQVSLWLDQSLAPIDTDFATWQLELQANGTADLPFHAWIARDDGEGATLSFFHPTIVSTSHTLGSIACGKWTITVGAYIAGDPDKGLYAFSSEGPTRDGRQKPEISAPGQSVVAPPDAIGILAAKSGTNGATRKAGTSMAAPHVTGLIALLLQSAEEPLSIDQIRERLFSAVRTMPSTTDTDTWHPRYGFGRVDAAALLTSDKARALRRE